MSPWTDERIELLRRLWAVRSAREIAREVGGGITRNAVIGKARRLNLHRKAIGRKGQRRAAA